jgi:hypothetical protein
MLRAGATALVGLGVTLASTFASSLGLSLAQQRFALFAGILMMLVGAVGFLLSFDRVRAYIPRPKRVRQRVVIKQRDTVPVSRSVAQPSAFPTGQTIPVALVKALQDDLHAGRELLAPISVPEYAMNDGLDLRTGRTEKDVYAWAQQVRGRIETEQPELLAAFDQGADLPAQIVMIGLEQSVERSRLVRFLEAKLQNLERIIASSGT